MAQQSPFTPISTTLTPKDESAVAIGAARRRLLLKGLGKGTTALAAAIPITTLATSKVYVCGDKNTKLCTVSGIQSEAHSFAGGKPPVASGKGAVYWCEKDTVTNAAKNWSATYQNQKLMYAFPDTADTRKNRKLWSLVSDSSVDASLKTWIYAYLNAELKPTGNYPFSTSEVRDMYTKGKTNSEYGGKAVGFLSGNLQQG